MDKNYHGESGSDKNLLYRIVDILPSLKEGDS